LPGSEKLRLFFDSVFQTDHQYSICDFDPDAKLDAVIKRKRHLTGLGVALSGAAPR